MQFRGLEFQASKEISDFLCLPVRGGLITAVLSLVAPIICAHIVYSFVTMCIVYACNNYLYMRTKHVYKQL